NYERSADPRVSHQMTLRVDAFGNVERSAIIAYPRRAVPTRLADQAETCVTLTVSRFCNRAAEVDWYRVGAPFDSQTFEIVKAPEAVATAAFVGVLGFEQIEAPTVGLFESNQIEPDPARTVPS